MLPDGLSNIKNILAVRMDNIGDVVMLEPALRATKKAFPKAKVTLLASPSGSQVAPLIPWLDQVISWRSSWQELHGKIGLEPSREFELIQNIGRNHFDLALIFTSFTQSPYPPAYVCYLAGIPNRVGLSNEFGGVILSHWAKPPAEPSHQVDRNLAVLKAAGISADGKDIRLKIPWDVAKKARDLLEDLGIEDGEPYIALAPGASCSSRRYPPEKFAECAVSLTNDQKMKVVILGSEKEANQIQPVIDAADGRSIISLVGKTSIPQVAAIISNSALVLANNSASLHLGDAFHRPMVILYSGTEYRSQWAPRNSPAILLKRETHCSPCFLFECPYQLQCLDVSTEEVVQLSVELIRKSQITAANEQILLVEDSIQNAINGTG